MTGVYSLQRAGGKHRVLFGLILTAYLLLATLYSIVTPIFEASDELWHFPMVHVLADNGLQLPFQNPAAPDLWRQEGSQPPLYYMLAAFVTAGIDRSDLEYVRRINPHADIGLVRPDGNANMIVHRVEAEAFPWRGTVLAVHVARLFSVALGAGTVVCTYLLARRLFPEQPGWALAAMALNAFLPMFLFISGSVNNDNLSNLLGNGLTLLLVVLLQRERKPRPGEYVLLGVVCGAGLLAKLNIGFLIPIVTLTLLILSVRFRTMQPFFVGGLISGGLTILIAGWWYWLNWQRYGDPTGLNVFLEIVGRRAPPANLAQLWAERESFTRAFWGFFGGVNVPMPEIVYTLLNSVAALAIVGVIFFLLRLLFRRAWDARRWLPAGVTLFWIAVTFASYLQWTSITPASQGRLLFGALSSVCVWLIVGLAWWMSGHLQTVVLTGLGAGMGILAVTVPFAVIAPAYAPPPLANGYPNFARDALIFRAPSGERGAIAVQPGSLWSEGSTLYPGNYAIFHFIARVDEPFARDYSLFAHLVSPDGVIVAQRDIYPAGGRVALSDMPAGAMWDNLIAIPIPNTAYTPNTLSLQIGWYHLPTGERLRLDDGNETLTFDGVTLAAREGELPNPVEANFDNQVELAGYTLSDLSPEAGGTTSLTLYWRGLQPLANDYVVFAHIIDPATQTIYAGSDAMPANWTAPTSTWIPGQIVEDTHTLNVSPDAPPGIYELEIGLYQQLPDGTFPRLRVVAPDGGAAGDYIYLTRVRVLPRILPTSPRPETTDTSQ